MICLRKIDEFNSFRIFFTKKISFLTIFYMDTLLFTLYTPKGEFWFQELDYLKAFIYFGKKCEIPLKNKKENYIIKYSDFSKIIRATEIDGKDFFVLKIKDKRFFKKVLKSLY